jgi:hypothetical protein
LEFSKEKNQTKPKLFSKRYFFVLFFLLFFVTIFFVKTSPVYAIIGITQANKEQIARERQAAVEGCNLVFDDFGRCLTLPFFNFSKWLLPYSATVFAYMIDTKNVALILNGTGTSKPLYEVWTYVRDLLNMAFIMVLLFSAFCTIFQVEQYNYKKLLWKIVLMALLVNFSFPITRFIIDATNILMYSIINSSLFASSSGSTATAASAIVSITKDSELGKMLISANFPTTATLAAATIMILMLAISFLAIGILLLVRVIVLAILLIFSPVAFVGSFVPGLTSHASKWWETLLKYALFGPTIILGVAITVKLMNGIGRSLAGKALEAAGKQVSTDANFVGYIAFLLLPIVLLWAVLIVAQKMGIAGAGAVMGAAKGAMKFAAKSPLLAARGIGKAALKYSGVSGGVKQKWDQLKKTGPLFGSDAREKKEAWVAEKTPYSVKGAINEHARKKANEQRDEWKKIGPPSKEELEAMLSNPDTDNIKARAAALELAESTGFDGKYANYKRALEVNAGDPSGIEMLNEKTKKKGRDLVLAHKINTGKDATGNPLQLQTELAKLDNADFGSINFKNLAENTKSSGDRGGREAIEKFFGDADDDRKTQISRRINKENRAYLGDSIFKAKERKPTEKPEPGTGKGARAGFV